MRCGVMAALVSLLVVPALAGVARSADASDDARLSRATTRCKLAELIACDEALNIRPNDPDLLVAEGDALIQRRRPGEAIGVYRNALLRSAERDVVNPKIALAQTARQASLRTCTTQAGEVAERACESAWLPGAPDEVTVFKRRGLLLESAGQFSAALDAYMAAGRLRPGDRGVARSIVGLSGASGRRDAQAMLSRGVAFMSLGHRSEALTALREAVRLAPDSVTAKTQLRRAERTAENAAGAGPSATAPSDTRAEDHPEVRSDVRDASIGPYSNEAERTRSN